MNRISWLSACSALALAAATSAGAKPIHDAPLQDRGDAVDALRAALLAAQPATSPGDAEAPVQLAQWGNWGNWGNWNNWQNWGNWGNWGNY